MSKPNSETGLIAYIVIVIDFLNHNMYASPLDSITRGPGYTLKIPKI